MSKDPFCDIYEHIYFFISSNSIDINIISVIYLNWFEKQQAQFISKFYSKIKFATLKKYLGNFLFYLGRHFNETNLDSFLDKFCWKMENEIITTVEISNDRKNESIDLSFLNSMNVHLENLTKSNIYLKPIEN